MDIGYWFKGLILGFSIAAPVGPMALLCIQRTLNRGRLYGLVSGLGIATADAFYGAVAGFGLSFVTNFLVGQQFWLRLVGGLFLVYMGLRTLGSKPADKAARADERGLGRAYFSIFLLTLTNPLTILSFVAVFGGFGLGAADYLGAGVLVVGVFCGSALWWLSITGVVSFFRHRFDARLLVWVNRLSGLIIVVFGVVALLGLISSK